ncbi:MAG: general secretion pathway protein C [Moritella sp.]|jgi:general secretion pathway protein C
MDNLDALKQHLAKIPQKQLATLCFYAFLTVFCYYSALLTWQLWPAKSATVSSWQPQSDNLSNQSDNFELSGLRRLYLFGKQQTEKSRPIPVQNVDAPKTRLRLTLAGIVVSSEPDLALAIIENKGSQDTYGIDEEIGSTQATLKRVLQDRVLIEYRGKLETLMLDGESFTSGGPENRPRATQSGIEKTDLTHLRRDLLENPASITDYVRISPVRKDGKLSGYRVNPGKKRALFKEVGLQPNDLAVSLNGYDLTDTRQAMEIAKQLKDLTDMSLTVERNGQLHSIYLSLPE